MAKSKNGNGKLSKQLAQEAERRDNHNIEHIARIAEKNTTYCQLSFILNANVEKEVRTRLCIQKNHAVERCACRQPLSPPMSMIRFFIAEPAFQAASRLDI